MDVPGTGQISPKHDKTIAKKSRLPCESFGKRAPRYRPDLRTIDRGVDPEGRVLFFGLRRRQCSCHGAVAQARPNGTNSKGISQRSGDVLEERSSKTDDPVGFRLEI